MSYNRRMGDGPRGNRSFSQPFQSGSVSPWQGGGGSSTNQGGIISQLTSNPQLALALTSLLQPQQQQPPSLLSLNTSPAFSDRGDYGRFSSLNRGREFRRPEPYYKSQGFGDRRRRSPKRDNKKNDKKPGDKKKEDGDVSMEDEDGKESKRDWKDEKNQGEGEEGEGDKEGRYGGVPRKYLNCFVCNKQMWDGESMGKHIRGRAHQEMMKALEESIHICVNILRENMRLIEDRKVIEWNRQNRLKKYGKRHRDSELSHCNMCDLKFMGKIVVHRRTSGHQRLKNYLHPKCKVCDKEFPARLEWIDHRLTPEHMRNLHKAVETDSEPADGQTITEGDGEEPEDLDLEPLLIENLQMESEDCILELDDPLNDLQNRLPAYKPERSVAIQTLKDFSGWMCELCNRSFSSEEDSQNHLKTRRHFHRFVEVLKEKFEEKERREKAEKEAAEKKKKEEAEGGKENGEKAEGEEEGDVEMYDPAETTEEKENGEEVEEEEGKAEEEEEEDEKGPPKKEVKKEPPPTPSKTPAKKLAGPKSRRGKK